MTDYRHGAACAPGSGHDPELWFPLDERNGSGPARAICAGCPVRERCLEWALATGQPDGVWGGLTSDERRALRLERRLARELDLLGA